ncbi:MAG: nicotinate phosphoribosyltransferase [Nocardioides sp.]
MATPGPGPGRGLCTDLYELRMAASYLRREMTAPATFSLFVRKLPPDRGFLVAAGLESCLRLLEDYSLTGDDLDYLHDELGFTTGDLAELASIRFTGDVRAVPEGTIVFAGEPILEVTAPLPEAQLVETLLLNQVTFATAIASKAARCRLAAPHATLVDFAARRTHGIEAALVVARSSAIAGFDATSYVEAARTFGLSAVGTMAHSYVQAFPSEVEAFAAFAEDFPDRSVFLVYTFDTSAGVRHAIEVATDLCLPADGFGIRLDSGDLGEQAVLARGMLDAAGYAGARIMASGGLDDHSIAGLVGQGAPIDTFGIGTKMGVSWDAPSFDSAYKLVAVGDRPVMKLSAGKVTAPGAKQV